MTLIGWLGNLDELIGYESLVRRRRRRIWIERKSNKVKDVKAEKCSVIRERELTFFLPLRLPQAHGFVLVLTVLCVTYPVHLLFTPLVRHAVVVRDSVKQNPLLPEQNGHGPRA